MLFLCIFEEKKQRVEPRVRAVLLSEMHGLTTRAVWPNKIPQFTRTSPCRSTRERTTKGGSAAFPRGFASPRAPPPRKQRLWRPRCSPQQTNYVCRGPRCSPQQTNYVCRGPRCAASPPAISFPPGRTRRPSREEFLAPVPNRSEHRSSRIESLTRDFSQRLVSCSCRSSHAISVAPRAFGPFQANSHAFAISPGKQSSFGINLIRAGIHVRLGCGSFVSFLAQSAGFPGCTRNPTSGVSEFLLSPRYHHHRHRQPDAVPEERS